MDKGLMRTQVTTARKAKSLTGKKTMKTTKETAAKIRAKLKTSTNPLKTEPTSKEIGKTETGTIATTIETQNPIITTGETNLSTTGGTTKTMTPNQDQPGQTQSKEEATTWDCLKFSLSKCFSNNNTKYNTMQMLNRNFKVKT